MEYEVQLDCFQLNKIVRPSRFSSILTLFLYRGETLDNLMNILFDNGMTNNSKQVKT